jgi:hypothetical protein
MGLVCLQQTVKTDSNGKENAKPRTVILGLIIIRPKNEVDEMKGPVK